MNDPPDCYFLLLHIWWKTWVQGDLRKLYVSRGKIKVISMKPHPLEDTYSYVKGRGCGNLGSGLRFIITPCLEPGDLKFNACPAKSEGRSKYCRLQNSTLKGSQSPPAALNTSIILSSRFQRRRRCRKPGAIYVLSKPQDCLFLLSKYLHLSLLLLFNHILLYSYVVESQVS